MHLLSGTAHAGEAASCKVKLDGVEVDAMLQQDIGLIVAREAKGLKAMTLRRMVIHESISFLHRLNCCRLFV